MESPPVSAGFPHSYRTRYTKLYRKDEVMVYFHGKKRRGKPWMKRRIYSEAQKNQLAELSATESPEAGSSGNTTGSALDKWAKRIRKPSNYQPNSLKKSQY